MFAAQDPATESCAISEACAEILEDILEITVHEECPLQDSNKTSLEVDNCPPRDGLKSEESLCNCTQTGEVKILVKRITDSEQEQQNSSKWITNLESKTCFLKRDIPSADTGDFACCKKPDDSPKIKRESTETIICTVPVKLKNLVRTEINLEHNAKIVCLKHINHEHAKPNALPCLYIPKAADIEPASDCSSHIEAQERVKDASSDIPRQITRENMEEMSEFLIKACERRQLRRLSVQEPAALAEDYQTDEMADPFASILEQGDHIMDTFHNFLAENGHLTVGISFSVCAKLLAVLLTLNTIFFSKIILWDSFLQYLF